MALYRSNKKDVWIYIGLRILLSIGTGIIGVILIIIAALIMILAGLIVFGLSYLILVGLIKAEIIFTILAVLFGIPYAIAMILVLMAVSLPFSIFYRSFSLYFLTSLNAGYTLLPLEEEPPRTP